MTLAETRQALLDALTAERFNAAWWTTPPPPATTEPEARERLRAAITDATGRRPPTVAELITWHDAQARRLRATIHATRRTA